LRKKIVYFSFYFNLKDRQGFLPDPVQNKDKL
jgi:hypothetical protein